MLARKLAGRSEIPLLYQSTLAIQLYLAQLPRYDLIPLLLFPRLKRCLYVFIRLDADIIIFVNVFEFYLPRAERDTRGSLKLSIDAVL